MSDHPDKPAASATTDASATEPAVAPSDTSAVRSSPTPPAESTAEADPLKVKSIAGWQLPSMLTQRGFQLKAVIGALALLLGLAWWNARAPEPVGGPSPRLAAGQTALQDLSAELAANAGQLDALLDEGQVLAPEEDPDLLLDELTTAELVELAQRLDGLSG